VDPEDFFASLPGWPMALRLASVDKAIRSIKTLDGAERYYRLGAGLVGAVAQLKTSVFDVGPLQVTAEEAVAWLRPQVVPLITGQMIDHVERLMAVRAQAVLRFRRLVRSPYRHGDLARALAARHVIMPEIKNGDNTPERRRWIDILHRVSEEYRATILHAGRRLVHDGLSDAEALAILEADVPRFSAAARSSAERLVDAALGGASKPMRLYHRLS
jgi:hypothetical protein